jgi:hypothetical protein
MRLSTFNFELLTNRGQAIIVAALFFLAISLTVGLGVTHPVLNQVESMRAETRGTEAFYAARGVSEDVIYRLLKGMSVDTTETIDYGGFRAAATTTVVFDGKEVDAAGNREDFVRKSKTRLIEGSGASFSYGTEVGAGGLVLENSSSVVGGIYASGPITGSGGNLIKGEAVSAGPSGRIEGVHATSSAYAHTIKDSTVDQDAYYQTIFNTTVLGALHPGSADQATTTLAISDAQIALWESEAAAGGVISSPCPYTIDDDITIGPKKITCDVEITGSPTVTLGGALFVTGNITVRNTATVRVAPSLGSKSVAVIADNQSNQTTSSKIVLENSASFEGSGSPNSYVLMLSQNRSAEQGGSEKAIDVKNSVTGALLVYAGHGEIQLQNSIHVKEVSAYRIRLKNSAEVRYESGLASLIFTSGPTGGYVLDRWRETE